MAETMTNPEQQSIYTHLSLTREAVEGLRSRLGEAAADELTLNHSYMMVQTLLSYMGTLREQAMTYNVGSSNIMENIGALEGDVADVSVDLMKLRVGNLEAALDDEEIFTDVEKRSGWLSQAKSLMSEMGALGRLYEQSMNGRGGHYVLLLNEQKERLQRAAASVKPDSHS